MTLKRVTAGFLSASGLLSVAERVRFTNRAPVFMYHRVLTGRDTESGYVQPGMFVLTASFRKQLMYLSSRFRVLFLEELVERISKGKKIGGLCAITFDDGWRDNYSEAFPVLRELDIPATIFLATGFMGTKRLFWPEEMFLHLDRMNLILSLPDNAPAPLQHFCNETRSLSRENRESFLETIIAIMKGYTPAERQEILSYLRTMHHNGAEIRHMLNWEEIRTMNESGLVRFGAHTVNHELLDQLPHSQVREEIAVSRSHIETCIGKRVGLFAYPNGNTTAGIRKVLAENGFHAAVTTRRGYLESEGSLLEVPRIGIHEDVSSNIPLFRSRMLLPFF
ncbi:polysaccharide deacetylase family protein [Pelotalea chapellei]|uniref:Polysaccharide deacetylase family protein n=1 Tax=Pelotalea chapellei TaxID=44671 RepID=A0ABS5U860_9BACT|nr:polysaccharide deacetylase family protein [Pelotalea chapellei]MBT1071828.1 polysaccharide deacetylase family protein [Pelotalea chapellei]